MLAADLTHLPSRPGDWAALLDAIYNADPTDERDELEWKSSLDLTSKAGQFHIARFVLAAANRDPDASNLFDGHAVMIIGLAPGSAEGITPVDAAVLVPQVRRYVGDVIGFEPHYLTYRDVNVLAITVSPPRAGDPLLPLRRSADGAQQGTIYRRRDTKTAPANADGIDALSRRAALNSRQMELAVIVNQSRPVQGFVWDEDLVDRWIDHERRRLLDAMETPRVRAISDFTSLHTEEPEGRKEYQYKEEVSGYLRQIQTTFETAARHYVANRASHATFTITNPTSRNLEDVELIIYIPGALESYPRDDSRMRDLLPESPREWGPTLSPLLVVPHFDPPDLGAMFPPTVTSENGGSTKITIDVGHLRPNSEFKLDYEDARALIHLGEPPRAIRATWTATATNHDGQASGSFVLETVSEEQDVTSFIWRDL